MTTPQALSFSHIFRTIYNASRAIQAMARDNREVEKTLLSKFAFSSITEKIDHRWVRLVLPDAPPILTKFSHTREDIGPALWKLIARQLRVSAHYLSGMIDCRNSREAYYAQLRTDPQPSWSHLMRGAVKPNKAVSKPMKPRHRKK